jgi:hypothetical protein
LRHRPSAIPPPLQAFGPSPQLGEIEQPPDLARQVLLLEGLG